MIKCVLLSGIKGIKNLDLEFGIKNCMTLALVAQNVCCWVASNKKETANATRHALTERKGGLSALPLQKWRELQACSFPWPSDGLRHLAKTHGTKRRNSHRKRNGEKIRHMFVFVCARTTSSVVSKRKNGCLSRMRRTHFNTSSVDWQKIISVWGVHVVRRHLCTARKIKRGALCNNQIFYLLPKSASLPRF